MGFRVFPSSLVVAPWGGARWMMQRRGTASIPAASNTSMDPPGNRFADTKSPAITLGMKAVIRNDWKREEIRSIYHSPFMDLLYVAHHVHRQFHNPQSVQQCTLLSIKTGGCTEDCAYCPQSARYKTTLSASKMLEKDLILESARKAKEAGSTRFCMGAAWRDLHGRKSNLQVILSCIQEIQKMGMESCCTLGMLDAEQARKLKEAGLTAYNHNLDTSREYYPRITTTRTYDERLQTLRHVREAGISVCCGGILGMGESEEDRIGLLHTLATLSEHPESVPINTLVPVPGTPLQNQPVVEVWELARMIATTRIVLPRSIVRLSAGRIRLSISDHALCFLAGINSIHTGEKLLTTKNNEFSVDQRMFEILGLVGRPAFATNLSSS